MGPTNILSQAVQPTASADKETLPDVPVNHLDYAYIDKCTDASELRDMLTVLQSGKEGRWFDLEKACEAKLLECLPAKQRKLYVAQHTEPSHDEVQEAAADIASFLQDISGSDSSLRSQRKQHKKEVPTESEAEAASEDQQQQQQQQQQPSKSTSIFAGDETEEQDRENKQAQRAAALPPVRGSVVAPVKSLAAKYQTLTAEELAREEERREQREKERIGGFDFQAWDKFDVDAELRKIDSDEEQQREKQEQAVQAQLEAIAARKALAHAPGSGSGSGSGSSSSSSGLPADLSSYTAEQLLYFASREKEKGNECFKAGEFSEALRFYTKCIGLMPANPVVAGDARPFANRAMAFLKLERWEDAEKDCDVAIAVDPTFTKGYVRRGMARHRRGKYLDAVDDFEEALAREPANTKLHALLAESRKKYNEVGGIGAGRPGAPARVAAGAGAGAEKRTFKKLIIMEDDSDSDSDSDSEEDDDDPSEDCEQGQDQGQGHKVEVEIASEQEEAKVEAAGKEEASEGAAGKEEEQEGWAAAKRRGLVALKQGLVEQEPVARDARLEDAVRAFQGAVDGLRQRGAPSEDGDGDGDGDIAKELSTCLVYLARAHEERADWAQVCAVCDDLLAASPTSVEALFRRSAANEARGRFEDALNDMCTVLRLDPNQADAGNRISLLMAKLNGTAPPDTEAPVQAREPETPETAASETGVRVEAKKPEKPEKLEKPTPVAAKAGACTPPAPPLATAPSRAPVAPVEPTLKELKAEGNALFAEGKLEEALGKYNACLELDATNVSVLSNKAMVLLKLERPRECADACSRALGQGALGNAEPLRVKLLFRRALAWKGLGKFASGLDDLEAVQKLEPTNARAAGELKEVRNAMMRDETTKKDTTSSKKEKEGKVKADAAKNSKREADKSTLNF